MLKNFSNDNIKLMLLTSESKKELNINWHSSKADHGRNEKVACHLVLQNIESMTEDKKNVA